MESEFEGLEALLVPQSKPASRRSEPKGKRPSDSWVDGNYIAGRIPLDWVCMACKRTKSARTLATVLAIWFRQGMDGDENIKLATATLKRFGVNRAAKCRALAELEEAGLITVTRQHGKNPLVTIIRKVPSSAEDPPQQAA